MAVQLDFHSFRGNFTTGFLNAGVPLERFQALLGHKAQGVTMDVYAKGVDVKLLKGDTDLAPSLAQQGAA